MNLIVKKKLTILLYCIIILLIIFSFIVIINFQNNKKKSLKFDTINFKLITSTHTNLQWEFKPVKQLVKIKIGEVTNIEYIVKNLSDKKTSGIANFAYYPKELDSYITKIECFCYDVKTLNPGEEKKYTLTMVIDPKVTKDSDTNSVEVAIIQFTYFNNKDYKEDKSKI